MPLPTRWKPWICIGVAISCMLVLFTIAVFSPPRVHYGESVQVSFVIYDAGGSIVKQSPAEGYTYKVMEDTDQQPRALFTSFYGKAAGQRYEVEVPACPSQNCTAYGGYTYGPLAWQYLKMEVTILEIIHAQ